MKRMSVWLMAGMLLIGLCAVASAHTAARVHVNVPFAFYANGELLPAGEYMFEIGAFNTSEASGSSVLVRNDAGTKAAWLFTSPGNASINANGRLVFNRYGDTYFLAKVEGNGYQANLKTTKAEREMRAQGKQARGTTLVAGN